MASLRETLSPDGLDSASPASSTVSSPSPPHEEATPFAGPSRTHPQLSLNRPTAPGMTTSSQPLGNINAARRPMPPQPTSSSSSLTPDLMARMKAFRVSREGAPSQRPGPPGASTPAAGQPSTMQAPLASSTGQFKPGGIPSAFQMPTAGTGFVSAAAAARGPTPAAPKMSLAQQRGILPGGGIPGVVPTGGLAARRAGAAAAQPVPKRKPGLKLSDMAGPAGSESAVNGGAVNGSLMDKYADMINKETGTLTFAGKAVLTNQGVQFAGGKSFEMSLDEVEQMDELGKGNYGTVYKVRHSKPRMRRVGQGIAGTKALPMQQNHSQLSSPTTATADSSHEDGQKAQGGTTGLVMAMKEIRLELEDSKFAAIIMEMDVLHKCVSPFIVDFYGAFFQEGAVYICMEFMDGGSIDKIYGDGIEENVLRKITLSTVMGLKYLKEEHNIIHRDVKPTNILVNTRGQVKICDFGVSGNLVASIAKTNIGCQSYMAPERISSGGVASAGANSAGGTYSVQSDIWSLGLTIIECALGRYPYPPETYDNIFSQLSAIVDGDPPDLPADRFSQGARNFVSGCLMKIPKLRPTYAMLLQHPWLAQLLQPPTITEEDEEEAEAGGSATAAEIEDPALTADKEVAAWCTAQVEKRRNGTLGKKAQPALHAAPLDATASPAQ